MKVILLKDVAKIGRKYDVKEVANGHALNFLIPQGLVETATGSSLKRLELLKKQDADKRKVQEDLLIKNLGDLEGKTIEIVEKANDKGHLFAGVHGIEIAKAIKEQTQLDILPDHIALEKPIREVGEHEVTVKVQEKSVKFKLDIKAK